MKKTKKFSSDTVMLRTQHALIRDLIDDSQLKLDLLKACGSYRTWRERVVPSYGKTNPDFFKRLYQVENFLKRYVALEDTYSQHELEKRAIESFKQDQRSYGLPKALPKFATEHLAQAKKEIAYILGNFSYQDLMPVCKFGKRAAAGLPAADSYLHKRVRRLTYSNIHQLDVFRYCTIGDFNLRRCLGKPTKVQCVSYTTVPKSYKAQRGIAPDTIIGGYLSQGLGKLIRERLETSTHIDLSRAQEVHKYQALRASRSGAYATIDMSKASDSFTWDHIEQLIPETWWNALRAVRTSKIKIGGQTLPLTSYMLMGSGHTFPLQTVMFYGLAVSSLKLTKTKGTVYVFGDDIIMPSRCVMPFMKSMERLGFTINRSKSFWTGKFRESCGGDFYDGIDVRPAMPEGTFEDVPRIKYAAFITKVVNGLLKRWSPWEIERTIVLLTDELRSILGFVPRGHHEIHAEYAAVLYDVPYIEMEPYKILSSCGKLAVQQRLVKEVSSRYKVRSEDPYYWDKLRTLVQAEEYLDIIMHDTTYAKYCREAAILKRMGFRLPPPKVGDQERRVKLKGDKFLYVTHRRYKPRYILRTVTQSVLEP